MRGRWNHNTHYHRALLRRLPPAVGRVLDVGCGDGTFARQLATRAREVVAIDVAPAEVERARSAADVANIRWETADVMTYEPVGGPFDVVTALAVVHHLPFAEALARMSWLLVPGGRLVVLGLWPPTASVQDFMVSVAGSVATNALQVVRGRTAMNSPALDPEMPLDEVRRRVAHVLPGATVSRRVLWRYVLDWTKPGQQQ